MTVEDTLHLLTHHEKSSPRPPAPNDDGKEISSDVLGAMYDLSFARHTSYQNAFVEDITKLEISGTNPGEMTFDGPDGTSWRSKTLKPPGTTKRGLHLPNFQPTVTTFLRVALGSNSLLTTLEWHQFARGDMSVLWADGTWVKLEEGMFDAANCQTVWGRTHEQIAEPGKVFLKETRDGMSFSFVLHGRTFNWVWLREYFVLLEGPPTIQLSHDTHFIVARDRRIHNQCATF